MTILGILVAIATILVAAALHEAMHAFTSYWLGDDTAKLQGRLTLNPIAHLDLFGSILLPAFLVFLNLQGIPTPIFGAAKPVPFNPLRLKYDEYGAALVAAAGPLTNLLLAIIAGLGLRLSGLTEGLVFEIVWLFVQINLGFFVFNMLPLPPLDGSRVVYAFAPEPVRNVMRLIEQAGLFVVFAILILFSGPLLGFVFRAVDALIRLITGIPLGF